MYFRRKHRTTLHDAGSFDDRQVIVHMILSIFLEVKGIYL